MLAVEKKNVKCKEIDKERDLSHGLEHRDIYSTYR